MTNFLAMVTVMLFTNSTESVLPGGNVKLITSVVYERHESAPYFWNDRRIVLGTNIPVATNITRLVWQRETEPSKPVRNPIGFRDVPLPPEPQTRIHLQTKKKQTGTTPEKETK